ncbi:MAG: 30S ribosomal protein S6 [Rhodospirillales bacterium]|jgi:small subunit ribosomal protein S6|nr:30S ribosomal protein S6 [Rhodospirillales bacterium]
MPYYENVFIARQDISATQVDSLADAFTSTIEGMGGKVAKREYWGLRNLAYRVKKNRKGHYVLLNLDAPAEAVHEMERLMRINEDVLRYLTVRVDELEEGPSAMAQGRGGREERHRRGDRGASSRFGSDDDAGSDADSPIEAETGDDEREGDDR